MAPWPGAWKPSTSSKPRNKYGNDLNAIEGFYYDCARFAGLGSAARGAAGAAWTVLYLKSKKKRRIPFPSEEEQRRRRNMLLMHPSQSEADKLVMMISIRLQLVILRR